MTARDDYPNWTAIADDYGERWDRWRGEAKRALDEIDRLRSELELCERRNEQLRKACDDAIPALNAYRRMARIESRSRR